MRWMSLLLWLVFIASTATAQESGFVVWADATSDVSDTGDEVCAALDQPPQYFLVANKCLMVFVPGSATEVACDVDMTGAGSASDYYVVLCH